MDFRQSKLSKNEWISIEKPVDMKEKNVLDMILKGYMTPDNKVHLHHVINDVVKLEHSEKDYYIYMHILKEPLDKLIKAFKLPQIETSVPKKKLNGADTIRIQSYRKKQLDNIEYMMLEMIEKFFDKKREYYFYNIYVLFKKYTINKYLAMWIQRFIDKYNDTLSVVTFLENTGKYIENNSIFDYKPLELYDHQKQIYKCVREQNAKLIFYRAPTSSGKTLTPLGLCEDNKVIFICASRHIGINLAKSAVNVGRKVGFAFGCTTTEDVRLHYFSVKTFITERGRKRPDHSDGANLELLICDIQSYEIAMLYMLSFFEKSKIILFWDEPTISMNHLHHALHKNIVSIWEYNQIENIILSSATLPNEDELGEMITKFKTKYNGSIHYIQTQDENTNITLLDPDGTIIMPHDIFHNDYDAFHLFVAKHEYTHSKYLSLSECAEFILYIYRNVFKINIELKIQDINNASIRDLYYKVCQKIKASDWEFIISTYKSYKRFNRFILGDEITTKYSHTLTYGPTIYLCEHLDKWINYFVENSGIHQSVFKELEKNIDFNNDTNDKIIKKRKMLEDKTMKDEQNENKMKEQRFDPVTKQLIEEIDGLERSLKDIQLNPLYIPNSRPHYDKWANTKIKFENSNVFTGDVDESFVRKIMNLSIETNYKILLLMGIGVFISTNDKLDDYNDIMKELADQKKLVVMIAGSEYINGTNFQFDHGYLADDIININQETIIQAIGRVGRKEKNKAFTFRFRDTSVIKSLFVKSNHTEAMNMNKLFF